MQRYFVSPNNMDDKHVTVVGEDVKHITKVMRTSIGDKIICCNGLGSCVLATLERIEPDQIICTIDKVVEQDRELNVYVSLAQGLPKGDKMELVIQKGTELGASSFIPFTSSRTIVSLDPKKEAKRNDRWTRIAKEAAEQAHRSIIPEVLPIHNWKQILNRGTEFDLALLAYENESSSTIREILTGQASGMRILLVVGPEGGFSGNEVQEAIASGMKVITLGKRILRTETAGLFGLSCISFHFEL